MWDFIDSKRVLSILDGYIEQLTANGYVKKSDTVKLMVYLFIVDFLNKLYMFVTDDDYAKLQYLLDNMFDGGCLMPYQKFCNIRATVGKPYYMGGSLTFRIDDDSNTRITDSGSLRKSQYDNL